MTKVLAIVITLYASYYGTLKTVLKTIRSKNIINPNCNKSIFWRIISILYIGRWLPNNDFLDRLNRLEFDDKRKSDVFISILLVLLAAFMSHYGEFLLKIIFR